MLLSSVCFGAVWFISSYVALISQWLLHCLGLSLIRKCYVIIYARWQLYSKPRWRHQMETFSVLLALCAGNSSVTGKFQRREALMFSLICIWIKGWVTDSKAGELRLHRAHYDVTIMLYFDWPVALIITQGWKSLLINMDLNNSIPAWLGFLITLNSENYLALGRWITIYSRHGVIRYQWRKFE